MLADQIGLLGLGGRSTCFYLDEFNKAYWKAHKGYSTCPLLILNADFNKINPLLPGYSKELGDITKHYLTRLASLGVVKIVIPNITLHETVDKVRDYISDNIVLVHPVQETIDRLKLEGIKKVMLIGSCYTMKSEKLAQKFQENNIELVLPEQDDFSLFDLIRRKVYDKKESVEDLVNYNQLVEFYSKKYPTVVACTELSLALNEPGRDIYDMARIQIESAMKALVK